MSKLFNVLFLRPTLLTPNNMTEHLESIGHRCEYCQGNGYFWDEDALRKRYKEPCPVCNGSGELDAKVTIEWRSKSKNNQ